jgi:hypothetical protein
MKEGEREEHPHTLTPSPSPSTMLLYCWILKRFFDVVFSSNFCQQSECRQKVPVGKTASAKWLSVKWLSVKWLRPFLRSISFFLFVFVIYGLRVIFSSINCDTFYYGKVRRSTGKYEEVRESTKEKQKLQTCAFSLLDKLSSLIILFSLYFILVSVTVIRTSSIFLSYNTPQYESTYYSFGFDKHMQNKHASIFLFHLYYINNLSASLLLLVCFVLLLSNQVFLHSLTYSHFFNVSIHLCPSHFFLLFWL